MSSTILITWTSVMLSFITLTSCLFCLSCSIQSVSFYQVVHTFIVGFDLLSNFYSFLSVINFTIICKRIWLLYIAWCISQLSNIRFTYVSFGVKRCSISFTTFLYLLFEFSDCLFLSDCNRNYDCIIMLVLVFCYLTVQISPLSFFWKLDSKRCVVFIECIHFYFSFTKSLSLKQRLRELYFILIYFKKSVFILLIFLFVVLSHFLLLSVLVIYIVNFINW